MTSSAMARLQAHARTGAQVHLRDLFAREPDRMARMTCTVAGLYFDFSKMHACAGGLGLLEQIAQEQGFASWRAALFAGDIVNSSERRAASHIAERGFGAPAACASARSHHDAMRHLVDEIRNGGRIDHILHIGIGGSSLGPALLIDALGPGDGPEVHVVSNVDGVALESACRRCDPARTLVVMMSKTFSTLETLINGQSAWDWLKAGGVADPAAHTIAVTADPDRARAWGGDGLRILPFADTVGGRYSLWSTIGFSAAAHLGWSHFADLLRGAAEMDRHFLETPFGQNAPLMAAALDLLHYSVRSLPSRAIFAYDERLRGLPDYLQQLEMESNGKSVTCEGVPLPFPSAPVSWGGVGTQAQHAVFQWLHQSAQVIPVEFVAVRQAGDRLDPAHHRQLLTNCFAQSAALMNGRSREDAARASQGDTHLAAARVCPGGKPSTTILLDRLDPATLGALLAFYEHRTFSYGVLMGVNPFDQWGVELGKDMARSIHAGEGGVSDPSTEALMARAFSA